MSGINFAELEQQFVRDRINPDFTWRPYDEYSPLNELSTSLSEARVAVVTTAGAYLADQEPFDIEGPAGDPTFREIPSDTRLEDIQLIHRGYNTKQALEDPNVVLPLDHLRTARDSGRIGSIASNIYSFMGFVAETDPLVDDHAPEVARKLKADGTDIVLLAPA